MTLEDDGGDSSSDDEEWACVGLRLLVTILVDEMPSVVGMHSVTEVSLIIDISAAV